MPRVPAAWVIPLPQALTLRQAMIYGTAGLTAAMCVDTIVQHNIAPPQDVDRSFALLAGGFATGRKQERKQ